MVYWITGLIHSGKSTTLLKHFNESIESGTHSGGFVSEKFADTTNRFSYTLKNLSSSDKFPLAIDQSDFKGEFEKIYAFDRFYFNQDAFDYGNALLIALSKNPHIQNIFIDEIGVVELEGNGFSKGFQAALSSQKNVYVCVRNKWLPRVVAHFQISERDIGSEILSPDTWV